MTLLVEWAAKHRLKTKIDADDTLIISGATGSIWEYSKSRLGVTHEGTVGTWNFRRDKGCGMGMRLSQNGDSEGSLTFDPTDAEQSRFAIQMAGCRGRRKAKDAVKVTARLSGAL